MPIPFEWSPTLTGPVFPPPMGANFVSADPGNTGMIGRAGGNTWYFSGIGLPSCDTTYWGPGNGGVRLSFVSSSFPNPGEVLTLQPGMSNLAGGFAVWTGQTLIPGAGATPVYTRFTMTVNSHSGGVPGAAGAAIALTDPTTVGLASNVGALVPVTVGIDYQVNFRFDASFTNGSGYQPALDFYDAQTIAGGTAYESFTAGFYYYNTLPSIIPIGDQITDVNVASGPTAFSIGDCETAATSLAVSGSSSNTTLVPNANIAFGGSGSGRNITVTPATGETGTTTISYSVFDGIDTTSDSFVLTVNASPTLGTYPDTPIALSGDTTITPDAGMTNNTSATAETTADFKGKLEVDPTSGVVRVTNAHPAGTYLVTVYASNGGSTTKTFTLTVTTPAGCQPFFSNAFTSSTLAGNGGPYSVAVGDVNGDGKQDIVSSHTGGSASVWLRKSDNSGFENRLDYPTPFQAQSVAVGDVNGDGKEDIVTGNYLDNTVSVLLRNTGNTGFDAKIDYTMGSEPRGVAVGDFNGDGRLDIVTANKSGNSASVLLRKSDNSGFDPKVDYAVGTSPLAVAVGDFNGDGKPDLAVTNIGSNTVSVFLRNIGNTNFDPKVDVAAGHTPFKVAAGDFDGDGKQDMAITDADANRITVLYRNAANNGFDSTNFGAGTGPTGIAAGDFNNDGKQDLAVTNFYNNNTYVYLRNAGNTGFDSPLSFATDIDSISVAVGDFNGDNRQDLVVANPPANNISVLIRQCFEAPTLGIYANTTVDLAADTTVTPSAAPTGTNYATASTSADFKGMLDVNPTSGVVRVTNAHPAGVYNVIVRAYGPGGPNGTTTSTFTLTVDTPAGCNTFLGSAFFPAVNMTAGQNPYAVAVGDLNGDGKQDFVNSNFNASSVSVWLRKSDNTGFEARQDFTVTGRPQSVAVGDINGDGKEDIVTCDGPPGGSTVSVLLRNAGNTGFDTKIDYTMGSEPRGVAVGDFNGDGRLDIVTANKSGNS
ncbi:MAG: FG-GAP repeat domain-containing protein, partial [Pyrinomonadaceae bacterium]